MPMEYNLDKSSSRVFALGCGVFDTLFSNRIIPYWERNASAKQSVFNCDMALAHATRRYPYGKKTALERIALITHAELRAPDVHPFEVRKDAALANARESIA